MLNRIFEKYFWFYLALIAGYIVFYNFTLIAPTEKKELIKIKLSILAWILNLNLIQR